MEFPGVIILIQQCHVERPTIQAHLHCLQTARGVICRPSQVSQSSGNLQRIIDRYDRDSVIGLNRYAAGGGQPIGGLNPDLPLR